MFPVNISKLKILFVFSLGLMMQTIVSQDIGGDMVYSAGLMSNPAYSGARGYGALKMIYRDYFPGNNLNMGSVYISYDTFLEPVQGGIGFYLSENKLGDILNDIRIGGSYSYHLRAGRDLFINSGFMASMIYRSYSLDNIVFPDQIDPVLGAILPTAELIDFKSRLLFDVGVGFLLSYRNFNSGISFSHLAKPDLSGRGEEDGRLKRKITIHGDAEFETGLKDLKISPLVFANLQGHFLYGAAGVCVSYKPMTISILTHIDLREGIYAIQPGLAFETGRMIISYNYFFDAFNRRTGIPVTQSNLLTLSLSLNNVDNSGVLKAINYPKL